MRYYKWKLEWYNGPKLFMSEIRYEVVHGFSPWRVTEQQINMCCFLVEELQWHESGIGRNSLKNMKLTLIDAIRKLELL